MGANYENIKGICWEGLDWIILAEDRDKCWAVLKMVMIHTVP
jgi:hypothetical protein